MDLMNLHDVFLNASMLKRLMARSPVPETGDPEAALDQDRLRLERYWQTALWVLIEGWEHRTAESVRRMVTERCPAETARLDELLDPDVHSERRNRLRETRNYMSHRDKRDYWDEGRFAPALPLQLTWSVQLHDAFSALFHAQFAVSQAERDGTP